MPETVMEKDSAPFHNPLKTILDCFDSAISIIDMQTYEVLFMNRNMKKSYGRDHTGRICWQTIHDGLSAPCHFCTNSRLVDPAGNPLKPYVWKFYSEKFKRLLELREQAIPWTDGRLVKMAVARDISCLNTHDRNPAELALKERTHDLERMNAALEVLLKKREKDRSSMEENILANFKLRLSPTLTFLKERVVQKDLSEMISVLESELEDIVSPFVKKISPPLADLTPMEIRVAGMVKLGKTNKEISAILNRSVYTIANHRESIRKKLNIRNKSVNLRSFLAGLEK